MNYQILNEYISQLINSFNKKTLINNLLTRYNQNDKEYKEKIFLFNYNLLVSFNNFCWY